MARSTTLNQPSFAGGELAPALRARVDLAKYRVGLALCRNYFVMTGGGVATRPGTKALLRSKQSALNAIKPRLVSFSYSTTQNYVLEFGHLYMRVIYNGGYALETGQSVTGVTRGAVTAIAKNAHGYSNGDWIYFYSVTGSTELNSSPGFVGVVSGAAANTFNIVDIDGNNIDSTAWGAFIAGTMARVYTAVSPYDEDDLPLIKFAQNADTLTITHPSYSGRYLTRSAHTSWTFTAIAFAPLVQPPTAVVLTRSSAGGFCKAYVVTSVVDATGEESAPTTAVDTSGAGTAALNQITGVNIEVAWTAPATGPAPSRYNVYSSQQTNIAVSGAGHADVFGYIGSTVGVEFYDTNIEPDYSLGPPAVADITAGYGNFGCNAYFQGRQFFAATTNYPQILAASASANFKNFYEHQPVRADDPFVIQLLANQVNAIKHLVALNSLLALTGNGAWLISGDGQDDAITALTVRARPQQYNGCSDVPPLNVSSDILYVQALSTKIRTLAYDFQTNVFTGTDITVLSSHMFFGFTVNETAYAEEPYSIVYTVRSDGAMPVMTYLKDQDIYAWTKWDTLGNSGSDAFISIATIPEAGEHIPYVVTKRTIPGVKGGAYFYMIERISSRLWLGADGLIDDDLVWALDSAVEYDGVATLTITGLHHLAGVTATVYADGGLATSKLVSAGGTITLDRAASRVLVGLPYATQLQNLRLDVGDPSVQGKRKKVSRVFLTLNNSRGVKVATMRDDIQGNAVPDVLYDLKERSSAQTFSMALPFISGIRTAPLTPAYQVDGSVFIEGTPGLPNEVLSISSLVTMGDDGG